MTAIPLARPVQLTLNLRSSSARCRREPKPYWDYVDNADLGGELRARRPGVQALLTAEKRPDGSWVGYHDLVLGSDGSSGPTRPLPTRQDALLSAAYHMARHCERVLARNGRTPKVDATGARLLLRWFAELDLR
jgi:hypothetical protein